MTAFLFGNGSGVTAAATGIDLGLGPIYGAVAAAVVVLVAGIIAWRMSNGLKLQWWLVGPVYGGPAWTATDSWVTNIAALGAILGTVISDSGTDFASVKIPATTLAGMTLLFLIFGGVAAGAPIVYGATAKIEAQGIADTTGRVYGFLLAGAASLLAVFGEMATLGVVVYNISVSHDTKESVVILLIVGAIAIATYSIRSLMYFATLPGTRPDKTKGASLGARRSLLGNRSFSATL